MSAYSAARRFQTSDIFLGVITVLMFAYLYVPIVVIVLLSFNSSDLAALPLRGLTLRWYSQIFQNQFMMSGLWNSVVVAAIVVAIAVPLGVMLAYVMVRDARGRAADALAAIISMPLQTPKIILVTVTLSHVVLTLPFVTLIVAARLRGLDPSLEEAAYDLGASPLRIWLEVLLPLLGPAVIAAALIAFTISFDEMVVSYFTIGTDSTLPVVIWSMVSYGYNQEINAIGAVIIAATLVLISIAQMLQRNKSF
jgi:spermidine/putrescine transport system permease protein